MNENLDLTKILDGCPAGTEFYSTIFGKVPLMRVYHNADFPIVIVTGQGLMGLTSDGRYFSQYDGECTLFPSKEQRDWSKFVRFWDELKEKFDPHTLQPFDRVLVRNSNNLIWQCNVFSHLKQCAGNKLVHTFFSCVNGLWNTCIPYNDETKHLCGTTDDCPEHYKWWKE